LFSSFKAGMFVRLLLEIPPMPAQTTEPRNAANKPPGSNIQERLENLRPKLDLLRSVRADKSATPTVEAHLGALEQELELLIKETVDK
jgi:hypothetical protein